VPSPRPRARVDEQQAQLRDPPGRRHHEDRADALAVELGDPAAAAPRIEASDEIRDDAGDQRLEALAPAVLARIELAVRLHHPAEVAGAMRPQQHFKLFLAA